MKRFIIWTLVLAFGALILVSAIPVLVMLTGGGGFDP